MPTAKPTYKPYHDRASPCIGTRVDRPNFCLTGFWHRIPKLGRNILDSSGVVIYDSIQTSGVYRFMSSLLEQYRISDFLEWDKQKRLKINTDFQRGSVWSPAARTFLIDTILRQLPLPKVYLRTNIDVATKQAIREIVDGQQRLRAIIEFANDGYQLSKRATEFAGLKYSTLTPEHQEIFLGYPIAVDQLVNASNTDVLEVFARLNSYTVTLSPPEKRHAKYQGDFKWAVRNTARRWGGEWEKRKILTVRERVRMLDDSLAAEMIGVMLNGITHGGQVKIDALYKACDKTFDSSVIKHVDATLKFVSEKVMDSIVGTPICSAPHFLMLFAAIASALFGIPTDPGVSLKTKPIGVKAIEENIENVHQNLLFLGSVIDRDAEPSEAAFVEFWKASRATTHSIASRRVRFPLYLRAITGGSF